MDNNAYQRKLPRSSPGFPSLTLFPWVFETTHAGKQAICTEHPWSLALSPEHPGIAAYQHGASGDGSRWARSTRGWLAVSTEHPGSSCMPDIGAGSARNTRERPGPPSNIEIGGQEGERWMRSIVRLLNMFLFKKNVGIPSQKSMEEKNGCARLTRGKAMAFNKEGKCWIAGKMRNRKKKLRNRKEKCGIARKAP